VRALTRDPGKADIIRLPQVEVFKGDFEDADSIRQACNGVDGAFLLTNSTERAEQQQIAFIRVAQQSGIRHIVKLSQLHADAGSPGRFLRYHAAAEAAIRESGLTFTFLRPNLYMQGLLNFRQSITQKSAFFAPVGDARISAVDVRDLADVAVAALTTSQHDDKTYSLTGPDALTFADMAQQLSKAVGRAIMFVDVPPESMRVALADLDFPAWQADGLLEEFAMYRRGEAAGVEPGVRQALGRPPRSFEDFARDCSPNRQQQTEPEWYFLTPHRSEAVSAKRPVSFALPMAAGPRSRVSAVARPLVTDHFEEGARGPCALGGAVARQAEHTSHDGVVPEPQHGAPRRSVSRVA
jgi:uncharacterized protein YbjT (DUF2867 family)